MSKSKTSVRSMVYDVVERIWRTLEQDGALDLYSDSQEERLKEGWRAIIMQELEREGLGGDSGV